MKKKIVITLLGLAVVLLAAVLLRPLLFPKTELTAAEIAEIAKARFESDHSRWDITNFDSPIVEKHSYGKKQVYKVTFTTTHDPWLGPIIIYFDRYTGESLGFEARS